MQTTQRPQGWARCRALLGGVLLLPIASGGCAGMSNQDSGLLGGAAVGAVVGGIVGHIFHCTGLGVAAGAVTGGVGGAVVGNAIDKKETQQQVDAIHAEQAAHGPIGLQDIAQMAQNHVSDAVIISQIQASGTRFTLTVDQINYLHQYGVSDQVILFMQQGPAPVVVRQPGYYGPPPAVVVAPGPYYAPPPVVGVGFGYRRW